MTLDKGTNKKEILEQMDNFSGAEIRAVATEAGYFAIRDSRKIITNQDFLNAINKIKRNEEQESTDHKHMFG